MSWNGSAGQADTRTLSQKKTGRKLSGSLVAGCAILTFIGVGSFWMFMRSSVDRTGHVAHVQKVNRKVTTIKRPPLKQRPKFRSTFHIGMFDHLSGEDRKMAEAVQSALDENDWNRTLKAATDALTSTNAEVRLNAVEALGWFGASALPELTGAMGDPNEDVRQAAGNHFESALQEVEKPSERFSIAMSAFGALGEKNQIESLSGIVTSSAHDFIDGEDDEKKSAENRIEVVKALVKIIEEGNTVNAEAAREAFNSITGNEWHGVDEAEKYLNDPENYEDPGE